MATEQEQRTQHEAPETTAQDAAAREAAIQQPTVSRGADAPAAAPRVERAPDGPGQQTAPQAAQWAQKLAEHAADGDPEQATATAAELAAAAKKAAKDFGGDDVIAEDEPTPELRPTKLRPSRKRVHPGARAALLGWDEVAAAGADFLRGYQLTFAREQLAALPDDRWDELLEVWEELEDPALQAVLAKDLGAHRITGFAELADALTEQSPATLAALPAPASATDLSPDALVRWYDPRVGLGLVAAPPLPTAVPSLPLWVRQLPREPVELCLVAVAQARGGLLDPLESTDDGASSALSLALRPHAQQHRSLERWLHRLQAEAEDSAGLDRMARLLWQARREATCEPQ